jgi:ABC-type branched-subunit amino acid transport system substrate-binding protein
MLMRTKRWQPASNDLGGLLFEGAPAFLSKLDDLVLRPRRWWCETLLPIIYLVCEPAARNSLDGLADRLRQARGILHSRINEEETPPTGDTQVSAKPIRQLLDGVVADLSQYSRRRRPLRFPHYCLAVWLVNLNTNNETSGQADRSGQRVDNALQEFIKERYRLQNRTTNTETSVINEFPWWVRIPVQLLPPLGIRLTRVFWGPPRWIAGNQIAMNHSAGSFRGLARKFMEQRPGQQQDIQQDEIDRLLVDAFMEDLRSGYRRGTVFGVGRRRTTYPVLLIDKIGSTTTNFRLLKLISDSRTDYLHKNTAGPGRQPRKRAYFHPLLIVAQGDSSALDGIGPPHYRSEGHDSYSVADIKFYYSEWYRALAGFNRTWFIPLKVPVEHGHRGLRTEITEISLPAASRPLATFMVPALLVTAVSFISYDTYHTHCGAWYWEPQLQRQFLTTDRDQCVGLGSSNHRFFDDVGDINGVDQQLANDLREVEDLIHRFNEEAIKSPSYLTVVYLSELTPVDVGLYRSELEHLRGIAVAQQGSMSDRPVRVLLANGGDGMDYGQATAETIAKEASEDNTLVAVVGLGSSRTGTRDAIVRLAGPNTHIPTIGTIISATDLATNTSPYYHQVAPTNQREAEVGAFYVATRLGARNATIYYSDDMDDLYSKDLRVQARRAFEAQGLVVREKVYPINSNGGGNDINSAGRDACDIGPEGVVFYAGRAQQLSVFFKGMQDKCEANYPNVIGGDGVSRFVLDGGLNEFPGLTVDYLTQASSLAWGPECSGATSSVGFFVDYQKLFGEGACLSTRRGGSLLAHDTFLVFIQGVRNAGVPRPTPDAVLRGIEDISSQGSGPLRGASGQIDYPRTGDQSIPKDKAILVLRGEAFKEPKRMLLCGQHDTAQPPPDNCPVVLGP